MIRANIGPRRRRSRRQTQKHASPRSPVPQMTSRRSRSFNERGWPGVDRVRSLRAEGGTFDARQTRPVWSSGDEAQTRGLPTVKVGRVGVDSEEAARAMGWGRGLGRV